MNNDGVRKHQAKPEDNPVAQTSESKHTDQYTKQYKKEELNKRLYKSQFKRIFKNKLYLVIIFNFLT